MFRRLFLAGLIVAGAAHAAEPALHSYSDPGHGFAISYPEGWTVDPNFRDKGYGFFQGDPDDYRDGVALKPTYDVAPGTNLESDQLVLAVEAARPADRCVARAFLVDTSPEIPTDLVVDKPDVARSISQPGDRYTVEHVVIIASHNPCVALHYYINSARLQPGDGKKPFDEAALIAALNRIASTLRPAK